MSGVNRSIVPMLDHVIPEFLGGSNNEDNIVLACRWCNRSKGHRQTAQEMAR